MSKPSAFRETVNLHGKDCLGWTRHFWPGCARSVVGYLQKLGSKDPGGERFCWPSFADILKHAFDWEADPTGKVKFSKRQVYRVLRLLQELHVIRAERRERYGRKRQGWVLSPHYNPASAKRCLVSIPNTAGSTYRSIPTKKRISRSVEKRANVSLPENNVSLNVSQKTGFVSQKKGVCVTQCVTPDKPKVIDIKTVRPDRHQVLEQVSRALTSFNLGEPASFSSEERIERGGEPVTKAVATVVSPPKESLKNPERAKAKPSLELKPGIDYDRLPRFERFAVSLADQGEADLLEITRKAQDYCRLLRPDDVLDDPGGRVEEILQRCRNGRGE
jgi:hypothetical protein